MTESRPSEVMAGLGIIQLDDPALRRSTRPLRLPEEAAELGWLVTRLAAVADQVQRRYDFTRTGMGIAAPQIGVDRSVAIFRPPGAAQLVLINPVVLSAEPAEETGWGEVSEGCLSFFDIRCRVPRPQRIVVLHLAPSGEELTAAFEAGRLAGDVLHEIDHLNGVLCLDRMRPDGRIVDAGDPSAS
ncbi:MAG: peptide deformylase [Micromonosporaceae bacterium]|nr:peptide deformylase [Micromonosporaceae bacterium]